MKAPLALIVEDEEDLSIIFAEAIQAAGYQAEIVRRGDRAMARLAEVVPALIVLDLHLPGMAGPEILANIRHDPRLADVHVMVATADPRRGDELRELADLVLIKPIGYRQLRDLAARLGGKSLE